jgi:hypothetical protein
MIEKVYQFQNIKHFHFYAYLKLNSANIDKKNTLTT